MKRKLSENLKRVEQRIAQACQKADRDRASVTLVAVTKSASHEVIRTLVELGVAHLGENRAQELIKRSAMLQESLNRCPGESAANPRPSWHMIGHLQRNKVKALLPFVQVIHSVDSLRLAEEIDAQAGRLERKMPILLEVNASGEASKQGIAVAAATHLAEQIASLKNIELRGLMTMAPLTDDQRRIRLTFDRLRELFEETLDERQCGPAFRELSMGMSQDFEIAIECGATIVRVGSALFEGMELTAMPSDETVGSECGS